MGNFWGPATEIADLGVVAEHCLHCQQITPCTIRSTDHLAHVCFVKMTTSKETACLCGVCGGSFPCVLWRYPELVPVQEAKVLPAEGLLARTNPGLAERIQLKQHVIELGGDPRFAVAYEQLEGMRQGELHAELLKRLLDWDRLADEQREHLVRRIDAWAQAWQFARQVAASFPHQTGCLPASLVGLAIWSIFLWLPAARDWLWGTVTVVAGFAAAALTGHLFLARRVRRWTREVLVSQAQQAGVPLTCFFAVVDDLPGSRLGMLEDLWPVKDQLDTIRAVLVADGKL